MNRIVVGSQNQTKIQATENIFLANPQFQGYSVSGTAVDVEEFGHPKSIDETIAGAKSRAKAAFTLCNLSVGLESGLIEAPETATGYLETTACALYDGERFAIGLSPSFEWPPEVLRLILSGRDGSQAFKETGFTSHEKLGTAEGAIHTLTNGDMNRVQLNELAIKMALIQLQQKEHYK